MAASSRSSHTAAPDREQGHDPEALDRIGDVPTKGSDNASEKCSSPWEVTLEKNEDPKTIATWRKWVIVLIISSGAMFVTCASTMVGVTWRIRLRSNVFVRAGCLC